jgi:hypothetical protein
VRACTYLRSTWHSSVRAATAQLRCSRHASMRTSASDVASSTPASDLTTQRLHGCGWERLHAGPATFQPGSDENAAASSYPYDCAYGNSYCHAYHLYCYA